MAMRGLPLSGLADGRDDSPQHENAPVWFWAAYLTVTEPVRVKHYRSDDPARELLIFLPGIGDVLEDYESRGFIDAAHKSGVALDITVADMHFGYYVTRTAVERLRD